MDTLVHWLPLFTIAVSAFVLVVYGYGVAWFLRRAGGPWLFVAAFTIQSLRRVTAWDLLGRHAPEWVTLADKAILPAVASILFALGSLDIAHRLRTNRQHLRDLVSNE